MISSREKLSRSWYILVEAAVTKLWFHDYRLYQIWLNVNESKCLSLFFRAANVIVGQFFNVSTN